METVSIDGVILHLSQPDELPMNWVGNEELVTQIKAAWLIMGSGDFSLNPRLLGKPGVGKTTLARYIFKDYQYVSLEEPDNTKIAKEDPRGFLNQYAGNLIIDEAQKVPELFSYIQTIVDTEDRPGKFILTGSHNFLLMENITQSLAGRCAIFHLLPFSKAELKNSKPLDIDHMDNLKASPRKKKTGKSLYRPAIFTRDGITLSTTTGDPTDRRYRTS